MKTTTRRHPRGRAIGAVVCAVLASAGCSPRPPEILGTLEYDRITVPAPASERIAVIAVQEGQRVRAGEVLVTLERTRQAAEVAALDAQARANRNALAELEAGGRAEQVRQARAHAAGAEARAREAATEHARLVPLARQRLVAARDLDRARAEADAARAEAAAANARVADLLAGPRDAQRAQARAQAEAAESQRVARDVALSDLTLVAPRDGRIDALPYHQGDRAPVGAPLAVLLVGEAPYARVYIPAPLRVQVRVGDAVKVQVQGREGALRGTVRAVRSEPVFTPYYALSGEDAARLTYLAEVQLGADAGELPAGVPVRVELASAP